MKKLLIIIVLLSLQAGSIPPQALAQSPTPTFVAPENVPEITNAGDLTTPPNGNVIPTLMLDSPPEQGSAFLRKRSHLRELRKTYRADEQITVIIDDAEVSKVKTEIFNLDGKKIPLKVEITSNTNPVAFRISPPMNFKPGRYRLVMTDEFGTKSTQDFTWGVLAINFNKAVYKEQETAKMSIAVLNEAGEMVCDARVKLTISDPNGVKTTMDTSLSQIRVNPVCYKKVFTLEPDYETRYTTSVAGVYEVYISAETQNGSYSITDSFSVANVPFEIERESITRIFPPFTYPMKMTIKANQDFRGVIKEIVPDSFMLSQLEGVDGYDNVATVSAQVLSSSQFEEGIPRLGMPFAGYFPLTQGFGGIHRDPFLKSRYSNYGVVGHDGVDFALPNGTEVTAVDNGTIVVAKENWDYGTTVVIQHPWGRSYYGHLSKLGVEMGDNVTRGQVIGLSGNTGLSTNPHLHFGIKPSNSEFDNGYYGKINPLSYLGMYKEAERNPETLLQEEAQGSLFVLSWNVDMKKGETYTLGYTFKSPPESPQFYKLGPLQFVKNSQESTPDATIATVVSAPIESPLQEVVYQEPRQWQLAIDADGSGTMSVTPNSGSPGTSGNTYTFTFSSSEVMDSGTITIQEPTADDWTVPQGSAGSAGYTTAVGSNGAIVGRVEDVMDSATGWATSSACNGTGGLSADTGVKQEGTASLDCVNAGVSNGNYYYKNISSENWSTYTNVGVWLRSDSVIVSGRFEFIYDDTSGCGSEIAALALDIASANTWEYKVLTLSGTRSAVVCYGFQIAHNAAMDNVTVNTDYLLLGPGTPTFSGTSPWIITVTLLDTDGSDTVTVTYGSGGGTSGVVNSSSVAVHTFTTQSRTSIAGSLTNLSSSPTVNISSGPTLEQTMRHGNWFNNGVEASAFTF